MLNASRAIQIGSRIEKLPRLLESPPYKPDIDDLRCAFWNGTADRCDTTEDTMESESGTADGRGTTENILRAALRAENITISGISKNSCSIGAETVCIDTMTLAL